MIFNTAASSYYLMLMANHTILIHLFQKRMLRYGYFYIGLKLIQIHPTMLTGSMRINIWDNRC